MYECWKTTTMLYVVFYDVNIGKRNDSWEYINVWLPLFTPCWILGVGCMPINLLCFCLNTFPISEVFLPEIDWTSLIYLIFICQRIQSRISLILDIRRYCRLKCLDQTIFNSVPITSGYINIVHHHMSRTFPLGKLSISLYIIVGKN